MAMTEKSAQPIKRVRRTARSGSVQQGAQTTNEAVAEVVSTAQRASRSFAWVSTVRYSDITLFLRQLILLLEAGTPILKALRTLSARGRGAGIRALVGDIASSVESGTALWQAFERHPRNFETVFVNLVKASEASGNLVPVLKRLADSRDRRQMLLRKVRFALTYPTILIAACIGVIILMSKFVIPSFMDIIDKLDVQILAFTQYFVNTTNFISDWWLMWLVAPVLFFIVYKIAVTFSPGARYWADFLKLRIPVIGSILRAYAVVEMTRGLAMLLKSGMSMLVTLDLVRTTISNKAFAEALVKVRASVESGGGFETPLREQEGTIPGVVTDMLVTGEESGQMDQIAEHIANTYEEEVNLRVANLGEIIQPIVTIFIGVFVLMLAFAIFVPLLEMINNLQGQAGGND